MKKWLLEQGVEKTTLDQCNGELPTTRLMEDRGTPHPRQAAPGRRLRAPPRGTGLCDFEHHSTGLGHSRSDGAPAVIMTSLQIIQTSHDRFSMVDSISSWCMRFADFR